jgi:hypothetical protein
MLVFIRRNEQRRQPWDRLGGVMGSLGGDAVGAAAVGQLGRNDAQTHFLFDRAARGLGLMVKRFAGPNATSAQGAG